MSLPTINEIAVPMAPMSTTADGGVGVFCIATSATMQRFQIPSSWKGRIATVHVTVEDIDILFGGSGVSVTFGQVSTAVAEAITINAGTGMRVAFGQPRDLYIPLNATHFAIDAAGATGLVYIQPKSSP